MLIGNDYEPTVIGIGLFGRTCGQKNIPGIYTKISAYVTWIERIVWKNSEAGPYDEFLDEIDNNKPIEFTHVWDFRINKEVPIHKFNSK